MSAILIGTTGLVGQRLIKEIIKRRTGNVLVMKS